MIGVKAELHRVYVGSWNEYDEGSGIYAADPSDPLVFSEMHDNIDVFSASGDPYEYIRATADGAPPGDAPGVRSAGQNRP